MSIRNCHWFSCTDTHFLIESILFVSCCLCCGLILFSCCLSLTFRGIRRISWQLQCLDWNDSLHRKSISCIDMSDWFVLINGKDLFIFGLYSNWIGVRTAWLSWGFPVRSALVLLPSDALIDFNAFLADLMVQQNYGCCEWMGMPVPRWRLSK